MTSDKKRNGIRCAIYTRKSTEEGLDQAFNSLQAQREACAAYIQSQRLEGWKLIPTHYDDGGFSGGSMERPALRSLLLDIDAGKIDTVVVYKVDRLTRSLADFAKIVERFDEQGISFISVTQQFNTTTSMGRLTLNVLLSFAQFEREVTGERIRDKIAASKRKGLWMGGVVPLGYRVSDRKLLIEPGDAKQVRHLYERYLKLGCVDKLKAELDQQGARSKTKVSQTGNQSGGTPYSRGALYSILRNRIYIGEIQHRDKYYPGEHEAILSREKWEQVQAIFAGNKYARRVGIGVREPSLLIGLVHDVSGMRLNPSHTNKKGKRYRYYVSPPAHQRMDGRPNGHLIPIRVPAHDIETLVCGRLKALLSARQSVLDTVGKPDDTAEIAQSILTAAQRQATSWSSTSPSEVREFLRLCLLKIVVGQDSVEMHVSKTGLRQALLEERTGIGPGAKNAKDGEDQPNRERTSNSSDVLVITIDARLRRQGRELRLIIPVDSIDTQPARQPIPALIKVIAQSQIWYEKLISGDVRNQRSLAKETQLETSYVSRVVQCAFLAPDIVEAILEGRQPEALTLKKLLSGIPMDWVDQRKRLGFSPAL